MSDNDPQFISEEFTKFHQANGVKLSQCLPCHPSSKGAVEHFERSFEQAMKVGKHNSHSIGHQLENYLMSYQTTPHATTGVLTCNRFLGRYIRTRINLLKPNFAKNISKQFIKAHHDIHAKTRVLDAGQQVMARNFEQGPKWFPGTLSQ